MRTNERASAGIARLHWQRSLVALIGFVGLWLLLDQSASLLRSFRGEQGLLVCLIVVSGAIVLEALIFRTTAARSASALGLRWSQPRALWASLVLGGAMLAFYPVFALATGTTMTVRPDWLLLLPGLFAQGGIAEELVFRGYLFRHVREGRSFRSAAIIAAVPFIAVHGLLFLSMDVAVAASALIVAVSISFPLAWLFERAGNSVWPPAIVHFVIQGSIKLIDVPPDRFMPLAICWMILGATAPWLLFLALRDRSERPRSEPAAITVKDDSGAP